VSTLGIWLLIFVVAALLTWRAELGLDGKIRSRAPNYRGIPVPTAAGVAIIGGVVGASAVIRLFSGAATIGEGAAYGPSVLALLGGFGLVGLWDDLSGSSQERGWGAHLQALAQGRATAGALKLLIGFGVALAVAPGDDVITVVAQAAVIALCANLFNLFDLRPGRSSKMALVAIVVLLAVGTPVAAHLVAAGAAVLAFLPLDLRERAMLGDTGANALGALVGYAVIVSASSTWLVVSLVVMIASNAAGQRPGLSTIIDATPPLRAFDRAGRAN
jgi:UDP-GlcNAc:undecaprenyl-phosphate/decaprenyl-phosphate GlcNAc-1-phosphate transferase